ncbi:putative CoA ligase CCL8 [Curcuma longa]|uniref:putative CoA ligase CCL8 n=1 Tax=Curcuma longa TaxID=136217 RepID=UPI003D9E7D06
MGGKVGGWTITAPASIGCLLSLASNRTSPLPFHRAISLCLRSRISSPCLSRPRLFSVQTTKPSCTLMEAVKAVLTYVSATQERAAIRAEQKNYSHVQLIASALNISNLLLGADAINGKEELGKTIGLVNGPKCLHGARVGIVAKPSAEFVAAIFGTWLSGGVAVPLALSYPESEILHVMNDSDISMILSTQDHQEIMENVAAKCSAKLSLLPTLTSMPLRDNLNEHSGERAADLVAEVIRKIENSNKLKGDDPALILYTSGTTGKPKGVVHTHNSINSQVQILTEAWEYTCHDHFLHCLPLHHVHGLFNALFAPLYAGSVVEFMPKFSVRGVWQRWCDSYNWILKETIDCGLHCMIALFFIKFSINFSHFCVRMFILNQNKNIKSINGEFTQVFIQMCGSSALPYPVMKQWEDITGHRLLERYGMTEFVMALSNPLHGARKAGTVGKPLPRVEVNILAEDGSPVGANGVGELCVRSPSLFKEYWKKPEANKDAFIGDGFFKTGDTVTVDEDGYYIILGRTNADIMKVGGYKLSALEIEAVLLEHEAVLECCVLGLPDEDYGEVVSVVIVPHTDAKRSTELELKPIITLEDLRNWAKEKLAPYKLPTKLFLWDSLPRNAMGKVNKKEMRKLLEQRL